MHLTNEDLTCYRKQTLPPEQLLRVRQHCDVCETCRKQVAANAEDFMLMRALFSVEPHEQELVLFAAGRLPEDRAREIEEHAAGCETCTEAIADLREFAAKQSPMVPAPKAPVQPERVVEMPVRKRPLPTWLGVAAAAILVAVVGFGLMRRREESPQLVASLHDGAGVATLSASGQVGGLANLDVQERGWIGDALRTGRLPAGAPLLAGRTSVLRGASSNESFQLLGPVNRKVVEERPEFHWEPLAGSSSYEVTIFTEDEKIIAQDMAATTSWRPSAELPRSVRLGWQVTARRGSSRITAPAPPAPPAFIELIPAEAAARIERARGGSHLELAVLYAHEGMVAEAQAELALLESANPGSTLVRQLRESLAVR
jgi:hypothetical protein